jgi:electron transfer flavoprotein beta subunit
MPDMIRAARYPVRKWNKDDAGIDDVSKIGLKGSPTVVSKVFGPTPRAVKAEQIAVENATSRDVAVNLIQKMFTQHPALEQDVLDRAPL